MKKILTQFEYIAQDSTLNSSRATPEEMVYLAIERSVIDVLKESAIDSFHEEVSILYLDLLKNNKYIVHIVYIMLVVNVCCRLRTVNSTDSKAAELYRNLSNIV